MSLFVVSLVTCHVSLPFSIKKKFFVFCDPNMFSSRELSSRRFWNLRFIWLLQSLWCDSDWILPASPQYFSWRCMVLGRLFSTVVWLLTHPQILFPDSLLHSVFNVYVWFLSEWNYFAIFWCHFTDKKYFSPHLLFEKTQDPKVWSHRAPDMLPALWEWAYRDVL